MTAAVDVIDGGLADDWLDHAPLAALECRTLRHQWPRMTVTGRRRQLPTAGPIAWKNVGVVTAGRLLERAMECLAGCGTTRTETFLILRDGRMVRDSTPRYRYQAPYLRRAVDRHEHLPPLGQDQILGAMMRRLYPKLPW